MSRYFKIVSSEHRKHKEVAIKLPQRASEHSVAYDFFSPSDYVIMPMHSEMIWTDVKASFGANEALLLNVRSSMGKHPVMIANTQGWVEMDYYSNPENDGNVGFRLFNLGTEPYIIKQGDKIGQGMFINYLVADNGNTNILRTGGFGSSGR